MARTIMVDERIGVDPGVDFETYTLTGGATEIRDLIAHDGGYTFLQTVTVNNNITVTVDEGVTWALKGLAIASGSDGAVVNAEGATLLFAGNTSAGTAAADPFNNAMQNGTLNLRRGTLILSSNTARAVWPSNNSMGNGFNLDFRDARIIGPRIDLLGLTTARSNEGFIFHLGGIDADSVIQLDGLRILGTVTIQCPQRIDWIGVNLPENPFGGTGVVSNSQFFRMVEATGGADPERVMYHIQQNNSQYETASNLFQINSPGTSTAAKQLFFIGEDSTTDRMFPNISQLYGAHSNVATTSAAFTTMIRAYGWNPLIRDANDVSTFVGDAKLLFNNLGTTEAVFRPNTSRTAALAALPGVDTTSFTLRDITGTEQHGLIVQTDSATGLTAGFNFANTPSAAQTLETNVTTGQSVRVWSYTHTVSGTRGTFGTLTTQNDEMATISSFNGEHTNDWAADEFLRTYATFDAAPTAAVTDARDAWPALKRSYFEGEREIIPSVAGTNSLTHDTGVSSTHASSWSNDDNDVTMNVGTTFGGPDENTIFTETTQGSASVVTLKSGTTYSNYTLVAGGNVTLSGVTLGENSTARVTGTGTFNASTNLTDGAIIEGTFNTVTGTQLNGGAIQGGSTINFADTASFTLDDIELLGAAGEEVTLNAPDATANITITIPGQYNTGGTADVKFVAGTNVTLASSPSTLTIRFPQQDGNWGYTDISDPDAPVVRNVSGTSSAAGTRGSFTISSDDTNNATVRVYWRRSIGTDNVPYATTIVDIDRPAASDGDSTFDVTDTGIAAVLRPPVATETFDALPVPTPSVGSITDGGGTGTDTVSGLHITVGDNTTPTGGFYTADQTLAGLLRAADSQQYIEVMVRNNLRRDAITPDIQSATQVDPDFILFDSGSTDSPIGQQTITAVERPQVRSTAAASASTPAPNRDSYNIPSAGYAEVIIRDNPSGISEGQVRAAVFDALATDENVADIRNASGYMVSTGADATTTGDRLVGIKPKSENYDSDSDYTGVFD